jgi:hypothetical protein
MLFSALSRLQPQQSLLFHLFQCRVDGLLSAQRQCADVPLAAAVSQNGNGIVNIHFAGYQLLRTRKRIIRGIHFFIQVHILQLCLFCIHMVSSFLSDFGLEMNTTIPQNFGNVKQFLSRKTKNRCRLSTHTGF